MSPTGHPSSSAASAPDLFTSTSTLHHSTPCLPPRAAPVSHPRQRWQRLGQAWVLGWALALGACGGGSGTGPADPVVQTGPSATDLAQAAQASLTTTLASDTGLVNFTWRDTVQSATGYRLQTLDATGQWQTLDAVPASPGSGQTLAISRSGLTSGSYRVQAVLASGSVVLQTPAGGSTLDIRVGSSATGSALDAAWLAQTRIGLDQTEPVAGTVALHLSLPDGFTPLSVAWYADLTGLSTAGVASTGHAVNWATSGLTEGEHLVLARVEVSAGVFVEWRRLVQVTSPTVAASVSVSGTQGVVNVQVSASSRYGITSVSAQLDGTPLGTLTQPNGCVGRTCDTANAYVFAVDTRSAGSGTHVITAQASDGNGQTARAQISASFANPPQLSLSQPTDGQWVAGNLDVAGTTASDKTGTLTTTATLGSVPVLSTTSSTWGTRYSLAGVPVGSYTLTVRSTDAQGQSTTVQRSITVVASADQVQSPLFAVGSDGRLLAAQGGELLVQQASGAVQLRTGTVPSTTGVELAGAADIRYASGWQLDQSHVVAFGQGPDCASPLFVCAYVWGPDGTRTNLSATVAGSRSYDQHPALRYPWVIWINQFTASGSTYTVRHLPTGQNFTIAQPASVTGTLGNWQFDVALANPSQPDAGVLAFFWGTLSASGVGPRADIYRWDATSQTTQRLTDADSQQVYVQTDGERVAWQQRAAGSVDAPYTLRTSPVAANSGSPISSLSTTMTRFVLKDGVLAWMEGDTLTGQRLMAHVASGTGASASPYTLSALSGSSLVGVGGGAVVWTENGQLFSWRPATGRRLLHPTTPGTALVDGQSTYLTSGTAQAVYRVAVP